MVSRPKAPAPTSPTIRESEFALLRDVIYRNSGILLGKMKAAMLVSRLSKRLRALALPTFQAYYERVTDGEDPDELQRMLDCIVTNETRFFRESRQFEFLEGRVFPEWLASGEEGRRPKRVRAWTAACSTGEETYSLAMSLLWHFPAREGWTVEVLGTDLSTRALRVALDGIWDSKEASNVPDRYLRRFMRRGTRSQSGRMSAGPELRAAVRFGQLNLSSERYPSIGSFDLIMCRNVLIYFDERSRSAALRRVTEHLSVDGYLLLGHAERPGVAVADLERSEATIYQRTARPQEGHS